MAIGIHIHSIEKITINKIYQLSETKSYTSKLRIKSKDGNFELDLFSNNKENLEIINKNLE